MKALNRYSNFDLDQSADSPCVNKRIEVKSAYAGAGVSSNVVGCVVLFASCCEGALEDQKNRLRSHALPALLILTRARRSFGQRHTGAGCRIVSGGGGCS